MVKRLLEDYGAEVSAASSAILSSAEAFSHAQPSFFSQPSPLCR